MSRSTLIALGVFVALGVVYFVSREPQVSVGMHKFELAPLSAEAITEVQLGGATPVLLTKDTGSWKVAAAATPGVKYVADENTVKALLNALADLKAADFVTERAEKHAEAEVDAAKGFTIKAGPSRDLIIGKTSKSGGSYVRKASSNEVYVTSGGLGAAARHTLNEWRLKTITTFKQDELAKVTLGASGFTMVNDGAAWKPESALPKDFRFDAQAAMRLAGMLSTLAAQDFSDAADVGEGASTITLEAKDARKMTLTFGAKRPDGMRPLRKEGDPQTYLLALWTGEQLGSGLELLRDNRVIEFEPAKANKLTITSGGKKTVVAVKEGEAWKLLEPKTLPAGFDLDVAQIGAFVSRLSSMRSLRLAPADTVVKVVTSVEVGLEGGVTKTLGYAAPATPDALELFSRGSDGLAYVSAPVERNALERGVENFKRPPPPPAGMGQMRGLESLPPEIRAQIEAQLKQQQQQGQ
ncbi:MAG: DUF4340 domain-containing protein [Archangium sp.]